MKNFKVLLKVAIILFVLGLFITNTSNAETESANDFEWTYTVENGKAVDVYISSGVITSTITVPDTLGGYPVARLGTGKSYTNFVNNATSTKLYTVYLPSSLEEINDYAFSNMYYVRTIGLTTDSTKLPNVTKIGNYAFNSAQALTKITLPETLTSLGTYAFNYCRNLSSINIPSGITEFGSNIFQNCTNLNAVTLSEGLTQIGAGMFYNAYISNITLPSTITTINKSAFYNSRLSTINLPEGLTTIEDSAFSGCRYLRTITFPTTIEKFGNGVFSSSGLSNVTLPDNITEIPNSMFYNCTSLSDVTIPNVVTSIGNSAFSNCTNLKTISSIENITKIEANAFYNCSNLTNFRIGSSIEKIGVNALFNVKDTYINKEEGTVEIGSGNNGQIHYLNCTHKLNINKLEGIKIINADTEEEITSTEIACGESLNYKIVVEEGYNYNSLMNTVSTKPVYKYSNTYNPTPNPNVETTSQVNEETTYTLSNVLRDTDIIIQNVNTNADLLLRKYITKINGIKIDSSREPVFEVKDGERIYKHTKMPVIVESGDIVRYTIRIYNEGRTTGYATEIKEYLPEYLQFVEESSTNKKYNWKVSSDGRTVTTDYLSSQGIGAYTGSLSTIQYKDVEIECKILANRDEENKYIASITEISKSSPEDIDSVHGNLTLDMLDGYKKEESLASSEESYIHGDEDDNDYECVVVPTLSDISTDYRIRIEKIDSITREMLNGAEFNLLNEAGDVLKTGVTAVDGILDFGMMNSVGEGIDTYYIQEVKTPEGYNNPLLYKLKLTVEKKIYDYINQKYTLDVKCDIVDIDMDIDRYDSIPIYTKEQLMKIGSDEDVYIEQEDATFKFDYNSAYKLMQDIDLLDVEWTPLNVRGCILNGNNFAIKNLKIETDLQNIERVGLFGTYSGYIGDLTLENVNIVTQKAEGVTYPTDTLYTAGGLVGYMSEGIMKNCKVTGTINADIDNVGGFVGHSEKEKIIIFNNCENSANVTTKGNNVGGLIGCVKGAININECTNKGEIKANKIASSTNVYNAGGFIGCVDPDGYEVDTVKASYDKQSNIITVVVKNDSFIGKYKLRLKNIDIETLNLIEGSTFDILDENKKIVNGYKGVELKNGELEIATIDINTVGTDVFYLKQITTPSGYEILATKEYIKVIVNKRWDTEKNKYVVEVDTEIINKETFEEEVPTEDVSSSKTGIIHKIMEYKNVTWTSNKVGISNSRNEGYVYSEYLNAGGFIGRGQASVLIENSTNAGAIEVANGDAGGFIGQTTKANELSFIEIKDSTNEGAITGHGQYTYSLAGMIAYAESDIKINNSTNKGTVTNDATNASGGLTAAGFVGTGIGSISVYNSSNEGVITVLTGSYSVSDSGGIIGKAYDGNNYNKASNTTIIIDNCKNTANLNTVGHTGGMIGLVKTSMLQVTNCNIESCEINVENGNGNYSNDGDVSGMVASAWCDVIIIEDCNVKETNIKSKGTGSSAATGGMLGAVFGNGNGSTSICENVKIKNCNITDSDFYARKDVAGMVGYIQSKNLEIDTCTVINTEIFNEDNPSYGSSSSSYSNASGIVAYVSATVEKINIKNCNLDSSNITSAKDPSAILGCKSNTAYDGAVNDCIIEIVDCNATNTNVWNKEDVGGTYSAAGGIVGNVYTGDTIRIENCSFKSGSVKSNPKENQSYSAKDCNVGGIIAIVNCFDNIIINNCIVDDVQMDNTSENDSCANVGGVLAAVNGVKNVSITNCNVNKLNAHTLSGDLGGLCNLGYLGYQTEKVNIENCNVSNSELYSEATYEKLSANSNTAGLIVNSYGSGNLTIKNCDLNNTNVTGAGCNVAGILGYVQGFNENYIENCNVVDSTIKSLTEGGTIESGSSAGACSVTGGIIATVNGGSTTIKDCDVTNSKLDGRGVNIAGIVGVNITSQTIEDCDVIDCIITDEDMTTVYNYMARGGITATSHSEGIYKNCTVKNTNMNVRANSIGGIAGANVNKTTMEACIVDNVNIYAGKHATELSNSSGYYYYPASDTVAGIIGTINCYDKNINNSINTCTVKNTNIESVTDNIGGIVGNVNITTAINDCTIETVDLIQKNETEVVEAYKECPRTVGGIIAVVSNKELGYWRNNAWSGTTTLNNSVTINNPIVKDLDIIVKAGEEDTIQAGGLIGYAMKAQIDNAQIGGTNENGVAIKGINIENNTPNGMTGGIIAVTLDGSGTSATTTPSITISNSNISNSTLDGNSHIGGITGFATIAKTVDTDLDNVNIESNGTNGMTGGLYGLIAESSVAGSVVPKAIIERTSVINSDITGKTHLGGNIGVCRQADITESTIDNVNITSTGSASGVGGIVGISSNANITDSSVLNSILTGANHVGGLIGISPLSNVSGTTIENVEIKTTSTIGETAVGGIVAIATYGNGTNNINNTNITGLTMRGNKHVGGVIGVTELAKVTGTIIDDLDIESTGTSGVVGGVVAVAGKLSLTSSMDKDIVIENSNISNSKIKGINHVGGNVGVTRTGKVTSSTIDNVNIESTGTEGIVSGICAVATNGGAVASSTDSEIIIKDSNVLNSTLTGLNHVGGCIGFTTIAEISGTNVNNTNIATTGDEGVRGGFAGAIANTKSELDKGTARTSKITITNSKLIDVIQTGLSYVDEFIGIGVLEKSNTTSVTTK